MTEFELEVEATLHSLLDGELTVEEAREEIVHLCREQGTLAEG